MRPPRFVARLVASLTCALVSHVLAQALIDSEAALVPAAAVGGDYLLAAGTIVVREPLVVAVDLRIVGAGRDESRLHLAGAPVGLRVQGGSVVRLASLALLHAAEGGGDLIHVRDAALALHDADVAFATFATEPDGLKPFGYGSGLVLTGVAQATVTDVVFRGHDLAAIEAYDRATLDARDSVFVGNGTGLFAADQARVAVENTLFSDHAENALAVRGRAVVDVVHASFVAAGRVDADFGRQFDAVRIGEEAVVTFERSLFRDHPRHALSLFGSARVTSSGNLYEANGGVYDDLKLTFGAILVEDAAHLVVRGDIVRGNAGGILEASGGARADVDDATFEGNGSWAPIYLVGRAELTLTESRYVGNDGAIFAVGKARVRLRGNTIAGNGGAAVWAEGAAQLEVTGNTIRASAEDGVRLAQHASALLVDNVIEGNRSGVVLYEESRAHLAGNDVVANARAGVAFLESSRGEVVGNRILGHGVGVVVAVGSVVELSGNVFDGNGEDVRRE